MMFGYIISFIFLILFLFSPFQWCRFYAQSEINSFFSTIFRVFFCDYSANLSTGPLVGIIFVYDMNRFLYTFSLNQ